MIELFHDILQQLERGRILRIADAARAMIIIAEGQADTPTIVRFLRAYNRRPPAVHELSAFVEVLRDRMIRVQTAADNTICNCGTGGDHRGAINVSTVAAFVIAAAGVPVAKHGNRAVSSRCGSTDCLAALGVRACRDADSARRQLDDQNLCFLSAPDFHPALAHAVEARRLLAAQGEKSLFNLLGPILNPGLVTHQSMGVFSPDLLLTIAQVLLQAGSRKAFVLHGDGYDELSLTGTSRMAVLDDGAITIRTLIPEDLRLRRCSPDELRGADPATNARIAEDILRGQINGAMADMVLLNAAAGICAGSVQPLELADALELARQALESGRALGKLNALRKVAPLDA